MNTQRLDIVNIGLMVLSLLSAFLFPIQTFLIAIMILGPLHYLTEMPWLERKGFFITSKKNVWLIIGIGTVIISLIFGKELLPIGIREWVFRATGTLAGATFFLAFVLIRFKKTSSIILGLSLILAVSWFFSAFPEYTQLFLNLFPTLIHVFVFTSAFILYGALKHRSITGIVSLIVYALCTAIIFIIYPSPSSAALDPNIVDLYYYQADIHMSLVSLLSFPTIGPDNYDIDSVIIYSPTGIIVMRFIAFAYMYHFLNWFSKTSIIKWHETKRIVLFSVFGLWVGILMLYWVDLSLSLGIIYAFGLFHVLLEYPLNHRSFIGIGEEFRRIFKDVRTANGSSYP